MTPFLPEGISVEIGPIVVDVFPVTLRQKTKRKTTGALGMADREDGTLSLLLNQFSSRTKALVFRFQDII